MGAPSDASGGSAPPVPPYQKLRAAPHLGRSANPNSYSWGHSLHRTSRGVAEAKLKALVAMVQISQTKTISSLEMFGPSSRLSASQLTCGSSELFRVVTT